MEITLDTVRDLARLLRETELAEVCLEGTEATAPWRISVRRAGGDGAAQAAPRFAPDPLPDAALPALESPAPDSSAGSLLEDAAGPAAESAPEPPHTLTITATAVGLFRTPPGLAVGRTVPAGGTVAVVESLRVPNGIAAPQDVRIVEIVAEEGAGVEYGQPLLVLELL